MSDAGVAVLGAGGARSKPRVRDWSERVLAGDLLPIEDCFAAQGAIGPQVKWAPAADDLTTAGPLRFLHSFWSELSSGGRIPSVRCVDPHQLRLALGYLAVLEPNADASDFRYRLFGTALVRVSGFDMTGRFLSAHPSSEYIRDFSCACYRSVIECRVPLATVHRPPVNLSMTTWHRLVLPFADGNGQITKLLTGMSPVTTKGAIIASG